MIPDWEKCEFGLYDLEQYAFAAVNLPVIKEERDMEVETLYDDISPTITTVDYETGRWYSQTTRTESMALKIISMKEKYEALIGKLELKSQLFELGMDSLTDRERDVIQVYYLGRKNNLGLSDSYFNQVLAEAQLKLCVFLEKERDKRVETKKAYLTELAQRIAQ
ncbi:hypothetical protein AB7M70_011833 [Bradyrhizobium japonicum]